MSSKLLLIPYLGLVTLGSIPEAPDSGNQFGAQLQFVRQALTALDSSSLSSDVGRGVTDQSKLRTYAQSWSNWGNTFNRQPKDPPS
jgi:hypothetical protein